MMNRYEMIYIIDTGLVHTFCVFVGQEDCCMTATVTKPTIAAIGVISPSPTTSAAIPAPIP